MTTDAMTTARAREVLARHRNVARVMDGDPDFIDALTLALAALDAVERVRAVVDATPLLGSWNKGAGQFRDRVIRALDGEVPR